MWRTAAYNPPPNIYDVGAGIATTAPGVNGFADGMAYVASKYGYLYALDLTTGAVVWIYNLGAPTLTTAAISGDNVVVGTEHGTVFDVNAVTGNVIWQYNDPAGQDSSPLIVGPSGKQVVVFGDYAGDIDTLSLASGALLDQYQTAGYIVASPAETDGNLLIDSTDGFLYDLTPGGSTVAHPSTTISSPSSSQSIANPNGNLTISGSASAPAAISSVNVLIRGAAELVVGLRHF